MIRLLRNVLEALTQLPAPSFPLFSNDSPVVRTKPTYEEAIALFKADPERYFTVKGGERLDWQKLLQPDGLGGHFADYITVKVEGRNIGYVATSRSCDRGASFEIQHFAVDPECVGTGVARIMAHVLKVKLSEHYGTRTIIFHEDHPNFSERNYVRFFTKLGAMNPDPDDPRRLVWDISQQSDEPANRLGRE